MKKIFLVMLLLGVLGSFGLHAQDNNHQARQLLRQFKLKDKLQPETGEHNFTGLGKPALQQKLNSLLNVAADDFMRILDDEPTDKKFQEVIEIGLSRFNPFYLDLDTEDRERICYYFEELMDDVGLESSGGALNKWMYAVEPKQ